MLHNRALCNLLLHRNRGNVLAAGGDDNILLASGNRNTAFIVDRRQIAGAQPAIFGEHFSGFLRQIVVSHEHVRALHLQFAIFGNANRRARGRLANGADHIVCHAVRGERCCGLRHAVALDHRQSNAVEEVCERHVERSTTTGNKPDLRTQRSANGAIHGSLI